MDNNIKDLFQPIQIGRLTSRNRIVMAPMNTNMAHGDGCASRRNVDYYSERARGGAGIVILEAIFIEWAAKHRTFGMGVSEDKYIPGLNLVARGIQANGALAVAQINHNGRILSEDATGLPTVAASTFVNQATGEVSLELTREEIEEMVEKYALAALRIKKAGFDAVEIHGAHGYLLAQFYSPFTNKRTDEYGGSLKNRIRMPLAVVRRVKEVCGQDYPVFYRLSGNEYFQGGTTLDDAMVFAQELEKAGVDLLDVSGSSLEGPSKLAKVIPCNYYPHGFHMPSAIAIKDVVDIPVVGVGRINSAQEAASYITDGKADMVAVGRQFIADAHWAEKARQGRTEDIRRCVACNVCLDILLANKKPLTCAVNPVVGQKAESGIIKTDTPRKIAVVGAGPAGLETARVAAARGHEVVVFEAENQIGGQLNLAGKIPGKEELQTIITYYGTQMQKLGVELNLGCRADYTTLRKTRAQVVVLATGGRKKIIEASWAKDGNVSTSRDVIENAGEVGHKVVIIGGGRAGLETASFLLARGHEVVVVEKGPRIGTDLGLTVRPVLMNKLMRTCLNVFNNAEITGVEGRKVIIDRGGDIITLNDVDNIVSAMGGQPNLTIPEDLNAMGFEVHQIGDCHRLGGIKEAVEAGAGVGYKL